MERTVPWSAGGYVEVPFDSRARIRIRVVDQDGTVVPAYLVRERSHPLRQDDGTPAAETRVPWTSDGIQVTPWQTLRAGSRMFVYVPGVGERIHPCATDVHGGRTACEIRLGPPATAAVEIRSRRHDAALPANVNLVLREVRDLPNPVMVRCFVAGQRLRDGWTVHGVHPGTYDYEIGTAPTPTRGRIDVTSAGPNTIEF